MARTTNQSKPRAHKQSTAVVTQIREVADFSRSPKLTSLIPNGLPENALPKQGNAELFGEVIKKNLMSMPHMMLNHIAALYSSDKTTNKLFNYDFVEFMVEKDTKTETYLASIVNGNKTTFAIAKVREVFNDRPSDVIHTPPTNIYTNEAKRHLSSDSIAMLISGYVLNHAEVPASDLLVMDESGSLELNSFAQAAGLVFEDGVSQFNVESANNVSKNIKYGEHRDISSAGKEFKDIMNGTLANAEVRMKLVTDEYAVNYSKDYSKKYLRDVLDVAELRKTVVNESTLIKFPRTIEEWLKDNTYEELVSINTSSALLQGQVRYSEDMLANAQENYARYKGYINETLSEQFMLSMMHHKENGLNLMELVGPAGSGKTTLGFIAAAIRGQAVHLFSATRRTDSVALLGAPIADESNGLYIYQDNEVIKVAKEGGVLIIDEWSAMDPTAATVLHSITDGSRRFNHPNGKEIVKVHDDFLLVLTRNGTDYEGSERPGQAMVSRVGTWMPVTYPSRKVLTERLMNETGYRNSSHVSKIANYLLTLNKEIFDEGESDRIITPRELSAWITKAQYTGEFIESARFTVISKLMAYRDDELNKLYFTGDSLSDMSNASSFMHRAISLLRTSFMDENYSYADSDKYKGENIDLPDEWNF